MARKFGTPPANRDPLAYTDIRLAGTPTVDFLKRDPTNLDKNFPIQTIGRNSVTMDEWILVGFNSAGAIWVKFVGGSGDVITLSDDADTTVNPDLNGNIKIAGLGETETIASLNTISILSPRVAKFVVDQTTDLGTHTTIAAALAEAVFGETIFVRPGFYTEDLTLKAGVNICAFSIEFHNSHTTIRGKLSASFVGATALQGLLLQTDGDYFLEVTGANATVINLNRCFLDAFDNDGINLNAVNGAVNISRCGGNIVDPTAKMWDVTDGVLDVNRTTFGNSGLSTTASNIDGTKVGRFFACNIAFGLSTSGSVDLTLFHTLINNSFLNATCLTVASTGIHGATLSQFASGTATAITVTDNMSLNNCSIGSSNASVIDGVGALSYGGLVFGGTGSISNITTTTQTIKNEGPTKTIGSENSAGTNTLTVANTSNTASSEAEIVSSVAGTSAGDAVYKAEISGTQTYTWGIDNDADDTWKLAASATLGSTDTFIMTSAGERTMPLNPCFNARNNATDVDVTGAGTVANVEFDVVTFDQGGDFAANTFTAPVTGKYSLTTSVTVTDLLAANTGAQWRLITSNRSYFPTVGNIGANANLSGTISIPISAVTDMDMGDTAKVDILVQNGAADTVDIVGTPGSSTQTFFSGFLAT